MAIALIDRERGTARLVLGAADGSPIILARTAGELVAGRADDSLLPIINDELAAVGRDFSPAKLRMHGTVVLRAVRKAARQQDERA
jgi:carbon-monoxide dehydrogenase medium subunit